MAEETRNILDGQVNAHVVAQTGPIENFTLVAQHPPAAAGGWTPTVRLPVEQAYFEDRGDELSRARRALVRRGGTERPHVLAVSGVGGIGKTAFGLRLAYTLAGEAGEFAEGACYLDLDEMRDEDGGFAVADALEDLLSWAGVPEAWQARTLRQRMRQFAERTYGRRLVLVLDNVRRADEAEALLPASSGSVAVVISRVRLSGLPGAVELPLPPMPAEDSTRLLRRIAQDAGLSLTDAVAVEVARVCDGLPVALSVAGGRLRDQRRRSPERLLDEIRAQFEERGVEMSEGIWQAGYQALSAEAARLYRLLPEHPGQDFTPASVAALLGPVAGSAPAGTVPDPGAQADAALRVLGELEDARLVSEWQGDRLRMHDLLRAHARRCARQDGTEGEARAARRRVVRWYRRQARRADDAAAGPRMRFAGPEPEAAEGAEHAEYAEDVPLADGGEAARWLERERTALYACVRLAHDEGTAEGDSDAWALCESLWTHFMDHRHYGEARDAFTLGRDAAQRAGHPEALARMRCQLARVLWETGSAGVAGGEADAEAADDMAAARHEIDAAVRTAGALEGARKLQASTLEFRGILRSVEGDWAGAAQEFVDSLRIHREIENPRGVVLLSYLLGRALTEQGDPDGAVGLLGEAHELARDKKFVRMTGRTASELARALRLSGQRPEEVARLYEQALRSARERGAAHEETEARRALATVAEEAGDQEAADEHRERVREIEARVGKLTPEA